MSLLLRASACVLLLAAPTAEAKPIAFGEGNTLMYEYGAGTMQEAQAFYAPRPWYSVGVAYLHLEADDESFSRDIMYTRFNYLVKRWNLPKAQGNIFAWGGIGAARGSDFDGTKATPNAGLQADYETRRVYASLKTDWQQSSAFAHHIGTVQLGVAPYEHDYDTVATWFVVQAREYSGGIFSGVEYAALLRLFRATRHGSAWLEAGATQDGKLQAMLMINF